MLQHKYQRGPRRKNRVHDEKHLDFIRSLPCACCLNDIETEAAHLRVSSAAHGKVNPGVGCKPDDRWTIPLCGRHHREQHGGGELTFWNKHGIDPFKLSTDLWINTGDYAAGCRIIRGMA